MHEHTDADLLTAWLSGDPEAYAVLVARHHGLVRTACLRAAPPGDSDDCIQAVFLVLSRRGRQAARAPALAAWLLRTAALVCRCARRTRERRRRAESAAATEAVRAGGSSRPEALDHLDECLLRLPERQRVAVSLHYLAGRSPEDVAAALGTSRDNAYQLLSRGLAGLRALLARRGVAVGATAVAGLLSAEGHAAVAASSPAAVAAITTAAPSAAAASLATGTITAMTIATLAPIAGAAGLLLAAATATVAISAEPTAPPQPTPTPVMAGRPIDAAAVGGWDPLPADARLEKRVSFAYADMAVAEILRNLRTAAGLEVDAAALPPARMSVTVAEMRLADLAVWLAILADARVVVRDGAISLVPAKPGQPPAIASPDDAGVRKRLDQRVSFDFEDADVHDVMAFLRQVSGVNIMVYPGIEQGQGTVTLKVNAMRLSDAMSWIVRIANVRMVIRNGAIGILPAANVPAGANGAAAPDVLAPDPDPTPAPKTF